MNKKQTAAAEKVLKAVLKKYPEAKKLEGWDAPQILDYDGTPVVSWESGPFEWALRFGMGGTDWDVYHMARQEGLSEEKALEVATDEPTEIKNVYMEPYYSFSLAVYPE